MNKMGKPWTAKDLQTLKVYAFEGVKKLSERLGRSQAAVKQKAYRYGISTGKNALNSPQSLSVCKECNKLAFIVDDEELCLSCKLKKEESNRRIQIEKELADYKAQYSRMDARVRKAKSRAKQKMSNREK